MIVYKPSTQRFRTGIEYEKELLALTRNIQQRMLNNLASNYTKDTNTNIAEFFKSVAKEFARLQISSSDVNEYKFHTECKAEYLFQILGDSLFLSEKAINEHLDDLSYKEFLIKVRNAYFKGSKRDNIESAISDILGIPVSLKEQYLLLRYSDKIKDTHKMFFDISMDTNNYNVSTLIENIKFFIDLIKPAHVIYDTRLVFSEQFNNQKKCKYSYITQNIDYEVYDTSYIYKVTYLGLKIYKYNLDDPYETWASGIISEIDKTVGMIYLTDDKKIVFNNSTLFYRRDEEGDHLITIDDFDIGDEIKYYAEKDSSSTSSIIDDTWLFSGFISNIYPDENIILLDNDNIIVYNDNTLVYSRDKIGEYRIEIADLDIGDEIVFKAEKYNKSFSFYVTPKEIEDNYYKQFDSSVIAKPLFEGYVKKEKDIPDGYTEGPNVVVQDGEIVIKNIDSNFYKLENVKNFSEHELYVYSLIINGQYKDQFEIESSHRIITTTEAKEIFIQRGNVELLDPNIKYEIITNKIGRLIEDEEDACIQTIDGEPIFCDQKAECTLYNEYEDSRKYFTYPEPVLCSGFFTVSHEFELSEPLQEGEFDVKAWFKISSEPDIYIMPLLPMLNKKGDIAGINDIVVYLNGTLVENAVSYIDPWNGIIGLNFIPPFDSKLRIDYYYAERYPKLVTQIIANKNITTMSLPNDLIGIFNVINITGRTSKLYWPYKINSDSYIEDELDYQLNKIPILNKYGELATPNDIDVYLGTVISSGTLKVIAINSNYSVLESITGNWNEVLPLDVIVLIIPNYLDNTHIYYISSVDVLLNRCVVPNRLPELNAVYSYTIIRFNKIDNAIDSVVPLLGHVRLNFIPPVNTYLRFDYYFTYQKRNYLMISDDISITSDTFYGCSDRYELLPDIYIDNFKSNIPDYDELLKIGYRYRAFNLFDSSILNSSERSLLNKNNILSKYRLTYSGEYLKDTSKNIILNDKYLEKAIEPVTKLNPEIPLFIKTYTDNTNYKDYKYPKEYDTYDNNYEGGKDLKASFTIIEPDDSGLIDYNPVCDIQTNKKINLYSDLKIVSYSNKGYNANLSSIDEDSSSFPFKFIFIEQYYPNREQRYNDYLDYVNQIPVEMTEGTVYLLNKSSIIKSHSTDFRFLGIGDFINVKNVPFREWHNDEWVIVYKDIGYTIIEIIDHETAKIDKPFIGISGEYRYKLTKNVVIVSDLGLAGGYEENGLCYGNIHRELVLNNAIGFGYGLPNKMAKSFSPGKGIVFIDNEPYPRSPDNPFVGHPDVSYYNITPYIIDGKEYITNRLQGITGIVETSYVINEEGESYGYTGTVGITGPSGALTLGITGPVGYANPFEVKECDSYVVPSGYTGISISYSEAEYRVRWRFFDQYLFLFMFTSNGIFEENYINMLDDNSNENIVLYFWSVHEQAIRKIRFEGIVVVTSKKEMSSVLAASYPDALIYLNYEDMSIIENSSNPVSELPEYHLNDIQYDLYKMIVREILPDNSIKVTEIRQLVAIV